MTTLKHLALALITLAITGCEQPCATNQTKVCHTSLWGEVCQCVAK